MNDFLTSDYINFRVSPNITLQNIQRLLFRIPDDDDASQKVTYEDATLNECTEITERTPSAFATVLFCVYVCVWYVGGMALLNQSSKQESGLMFTQY